MKPVEHHIIVERIRQTPGTWRRESYRVLYQGEVIIARTRDPEHDACRALLARDITGKLAVGTKSEVCLNMDIEKAAKLAVQENDKLGPRLAKWVPFTPFGPDKGALTEG